MCDLWIDWNASLSFIYKGLQGFLMDADGKNEKFTLLDIRFTFTPQSNALNGHLFDISPSL